MLFIHFPPIEINPNDETLLSTDGKAFAKLKIVSTAEKRTVFLTEHTLLFVIKGAKLLHFGEETIRVESDSIVLLRKGVYVMAEYMEKGLNFEALLVFFPHKIIKDTLSISNSLTFNQVSDVPYLVIDSNEYLADYIILFRKYFSTPHLKNIKLLELKQKELLQLLICTTTSNEFRAFVNSLADNKPASIEDIVSRYLFQPMSISDYANLSNRSLASFKRDFKKKFNATPRQWVNQKRLERAYLLLINTNDRIHEIADSCGFESSSYFIKLFKQKYGYTPQKFRTKSII